MAKRRVWLWVVFGVGAVLVAGVVAVAMAAGMLHSMEKQSSKKHPDGLSQQAVDARFQQMRTRIEGEIHRPLTPYRSRSGSHQSCHADGDFFGPGAEGTETVLTFKAVLTRAQTATTPIPPGSDPKGDLVSTESVLTAIRQDWLKQPAASAGFEGDMMANGGGVVPGLGISWSPDAKSSDDRNEDFGAKLYVSLGHDGASRDRVPRDARDGDSDLLSVELDGPCVYPATTG
ncbi:hypothetical protein [Actinomadura rupiterrae]|uniref:hypothetical protein n=1 Tax=Actinomadura rupiterrae TaxID=559627 RepID=UPI0020A51A1E|nr:hypothetical protein [Actinomadura rupiterrae]MCP2336200.1 hypothetical protein [Actinomadura rupiterrae]